MKILVLEPDVNAHAQIRDALERDHELVITDDPEDALSCVNNVDLVVFEVRFPQKEDRDIHNGFIFINQVRKVKKDMPAVLLSRYYDDRDEVSRTVVRRYANIGLPKPFTCVKLRDAVLEAHAEGWA